MPTTGPRHAPVGLLDALGVEDDPLQAADDVAGLVQPLLGGGVDVDRVRAGGDVGQMLPVPRVDLDHVVDAGVVGVLHLGEPEVGALAGVAGHDVVDDGAAVPVGGAAHLPELVFGAERRIDLGADPVEVPVHARGELPAGDAAGPLHRPGVDGFDADLGERLPHLLVGHRLEERLVGPGDQRQRIGGEPHRRGVDGAARVGRGVRVLPHRALPGELLADLVGVGQHRLATAATTRRPGCRRSPGRPGRPSAG